ncbi:YadA-like family protein [Bartonella sp. F02]|uniref:YadA-like family protein n=1 Tax=Bartonella sp. F02 TaxID=2967262 RepID=UPI0022A96185|nr:YadA-like family protein [Bartonella sp. F02]MCZ2328926.1 YadA-like family protein [Bartonella sp. F02]
MKKTFLTSKKNDCTCSFYCRFLIKAISFKIAGVVLLSSSSLVFAYDAKIVRYANVRFYNSGPPSLEYFDLGFAEYLEYSLPIFQGYWVPDMTIGDILTPPSNSSELKPKYKFHHNVASALQAIGENSVKMQSAVGYLKRDIDEKEMEFYKKIYEISKKTLSWDAGKKAFAANREGQNRKITDIAKGNITKHSSDAITGQQLYSMGNKLARFLGGNSQYTDGQWTAPTFKVTRFNSNGSSTGLSTHSVGKAFRIVNGSMSNINSRVNNVKEAIQTVEYKAVSYDINDAGKKTNKITLTGGDESEPVLLDNVADGQVNENSKQAVNGRQLHQNMAITLKQANDYTNQKAHYAAIENTKNILNLSYNVNHVRKEAQQAAAISLAVSNLRYNDTPGKLSIAFSSGFWRNQSAIAVGIGYTSENGKTRSNISLSGAGGHFGIGGGFNLTLN